MPKCIKCEVAEVLPDQIYCSECATIERQKEANFWPRKHPNWTYGIALLASAIIASLNIILSEDHWGYPLFFIVVLVGGFLVLWTKGRLSLCILAFCPVLLMIVALYAKKQGTTRPA